MIKAYYTAINGSTSTQNYLDVLSNNLANVQTAGYKRSKPNFSDLLYTNVRGDGSANAEAKAGSGSKLGKSDVVFSEGASMRTEAPYDFAIRGEGFFGVLHGEEILFTRGGSFQVSTFEDEDYLTYQGGYVLNNEEEPIILENKDDINNIGVFVFDNNSNLEQVGSNFFRASENVEHTLLENSSVMRGFLESSNVDTPLEIIKLMQVSKSFQLNSSVIKTADEIEQIINTLRA